MKCPTWARRVSQSPRAPIVRVSKTDTSQIARSPAFNHDQSNDSEAEYDRLRDLARQEASKRGSCFQRVRFPPSYLYTSKINS